MEGSCKQIEVSSCAQPAVVGSSAWVLDRGLTVPHLKNPEYYEILTLFLAL
jgi:hypothetical protein